MASAADVMKMVKDNEVKFVDFRFTDTRGKEQHVSVPVKAFNDSKFTDGHAFDGSSIAGWKGIQASDMLLMPDPDSARMDPFFDEPTLALTCDVLEPSTGKGYERDPRTIARYSFSIVWRSNCFLIWRCARAPLASSTIPLVSLSMRWHRRTGTGRSAPSE